MNSYIHKLWSYLVISALVLAFVGIASCTRTEQIPAPTTPTGFPAPPVTSPSILGVAASISIVDGFLTDDVDFDVRTSASGIYADWAGDLIYYRDVMPPATSEESALTAEGTYQSTTDSFVSWKDFTPGNHTFSIQLVKPDLSPLDSSVEANIELNIPSAANQPLIQSLGIQMLCQPGFVPPQMPGRPEGSAACADIVVSLNTHNFRIASDKIGQSPVPGEGHFIFYFNVTPPIVPGQSALTEQGTYVISADSIATWLGVLPGKYNVWVQLVNNDNTPLESPVVAGGSIIVPIDANRY